MEFVHYDFDPVADSGIAHGHVRVDSLRDFLANKLSAIIERVEGKDFADIYFLLRVAGLDLSQGIADCERKFGWPGLPYLLQAAFLRAERIEVLPETTPPIDLDELRAFFRERAKELIRLDDQDEDGQA